MKIVINVCLGGYGLSKEAYEYLGMEFDCHEDGYELGKLCFFDGRAFEKDRTNNKLIDCVEALGDKASGSFARLKVVEIPDDVDYVIEEYDGLEHIAEAHRTWS